MKLKSQRPHIKFNWNLPMGPLAPPIPGSHGKSEVPEATPWSGGTGKVDHLEHTQAHCFTHCLWLRSRSSSRVLMTGAIWPAKPKLLIFIFIESLLTPE